MNDLRNFNPQTSSEAGRLSSLMGRGTQFLGCKFAILGGAMTWVSDAKLVSSISNAGGFGVLASGSMPQDVLAKEIDATRALTKENFGVNLITLHPDLSGLIDVCIDRGVSHVVLAGGLPDRESIKKIKGANIKLICFAPALAIAKRLVGNGVDALIIEGFEAGGHIGPVSTSVLVQEILPHISEVPIFVAGGIGTGQLMLSYLEMGASGIQMGTRFVCAHECNAHENFKKAFLRAAGRHAIVSSGIDQRLPVIPVRALENKGTKRFLEFQQEMIRKLDAGEVDPKDAQLKVEHYWAGALRRAVIDGDVEEGSLMAGQSVGLVKALQSTQEIINDIVTQSLEALRMRSPGKSEAA